MFDIAIIGLGPAGSTLARLLNKKYKIIAIDNKNEKQNKCCGGLLAPDAQKAIAKLNINLPKDVLVDPQIFSVKVLDFDNNIENNYQRFYINMNRFKFDQFLISLIPNNVKIQNGYCTKIKKIKNYYELDYTNNQKEYNIKAKIIIGADGANSIVRNTLFSKKKIKKYIAIQEWYKEENQNPFYSCIFDKELTDSYCWTISKDNHLIIGGAFPITDANKKFELLKNKLKAKNIVFNKLLKKEGCYVYISSLNKIETGKNNAYLIGEAAGMISPSSLEGISYAIESASTLAKVLNKSLTNSNFYFKSIKLRLKLYLKIIKKPFMYNKYLRYLIMKSNIQALRK